MFDQKKQQRQAKDVSKKTCFKCEQIGHVGRKCPNLKLVDVEKKKSEVVNHKSTKFVSKQTWKPKTPKFESKQIWKPDKRNIQNDSRFYQRNVSNG
ncbi:putative transcription factor interactor and regulator CCHC(Zn) family [Helianthus anomalus]